MSRIDDLIQECLSPDRTQLNMRDKFIGLRGTMELMTKGEALKDLKIFILSNNQTGDEGAEAIAECPYLKNVEVLRDGQDPPRLVLKGEALKISRSLRAQKCHLSLSHSEVWAVAIVILEDQEPIPE